MAKKRFEDLMGLTSGVAPIRDDDESTPKVKTAPGQMIGLSTQRDDALDRADKAEAEIEAARAELKRMAEQGMVGEIPLSEIFEIEGRRRKLTAEQYSELLENLRFNKLVQAITLRKRMVGGYEIISGHNRVAVYRELGRETILAVVDHDADTGRDNLDAFYANLLQPALPDFEKYIGFKKRQDESGKTQKDLAKEAGLSEQYLSDIFSFDKLPGQSKEILASHPHALGAGAAAKLVIAATNGKEDKVIEAIERLASDANWTQQQAIAYANTKSDAPKSLNPVLIKDWKDARKNFCQIASRGGMVNIKFSDQAIAAEWLNKIEAFVRNELIKNNS